MAKLALSPKKALGLFIFITVVLITQAVWWITFMARLLDEKVNMAVELGADKTFVDHIQKEEISRQIMVGLEGVFFLVLVGLGAWLIYRALVNNEELKFRQQNFLMAVTHELKTPLASMKIYLDTLKSDKIPQEKKISIIPGLKGDVNRLEKLVENILDAGRFERSGYQLQVEEFDITRLLNDSLAKLSEYNLKKELLINREGLDREIIFYGDPNAIGRAFDALLENSLKYNDKGNVKINISLSVEKKQINLSIADNGVGIEKKNLDKIFERFYRVGQELNRSNPGTGLGLYLCREIIKAHKGTITAHSEGLGHGVEFSIQLKVNKHENNFISRG